MDPDETTDPEIQPSAPYEVVLVEDLEPLDAEPDPDDTEEVEEEEYTPHVRVRVARNGRGTFVVVSARVPFMRAAGEAALAAVAQALLPGSTVTVSGPPRKR